MKIGILGIALLALSAGAMAAAPAEQPADEGAQQEKKICRVDRATGSLTRRTRICLTRAEWNELHRRTKRGLDDFNRGASGGCRPPADPTIGTMCGG